MKLQIISFAKVAADIKASQCGTRSEPMSTQFNTSSHKKHEISAVIPETHHLEHALPPWDLYMYSLWLPVIMRHQKNKEYHVIHLPSFLFDDLMQCFAAWINRGSIREDILDDVASSWSSFLDSPLRECLSDKAESEWFVRLDQNSPKDSTLVHGPVKTMKDVVKKLASSFRAYGALQREAEEANAQDRKMDIKVFLTTWDKDMDPSTEYRVFVPPPGARDGNAKRGYTVADFHVSAISQYRWCFPHAASSSPGWTPKMVAEGTDHAAKDILQDSLVGYMQTCIDPQKRGQLLKYGFTFDMSMQFRESEDAYVYELIEINPFGAMSGCGACLFNWIDDARILYGLHGDEAVFRMTIGAA